MIQHYSQLAAIPAEPLLSTIEAQLLANRWARERGLAWDDRVCAFVAEGGKVLGRELVSKSYEFNLREEA